MFISSYRVKLLSNILFLLSEELPLVCLVGPPAISSPSFSSFWKKSSFHLQFWKLFLWNIDFWLYKCPPPTRRVQSLKNCHCIVFWFDRFWWEVCYIFYLCSSICKVIFPSLTTFSIFPLSLIFSHFTMMYLDTCVWLFIFLCFGYFGKSLSCLRFSGSLRFVVWYLSLFLENFRPLSLQIFFFSILFFFSFWDSNYVYVKPFEIVP